MRKNERRAAQADVCQVPCFDFTVVRRLRSSLPDQEVLENATALFATLADRTRLKILHALSGGEELCVCDVAHVLGSSVASASHHLRKLHDYGLVKYRTDGKMAYYSLRDEFAAGLVADALRSLKTQRLTVLTNRRGRVARAAR